MYRLLAPVLLVTCLAAVAEPYTGFYTGAIIPTPQEAKYSAEAWEVPVHGAVAGLTIVLAPTAGETERLAAEELAERVQYVSGARPTIGEAASLPTSGLFLALGLRQGNPLTRRVGTPGEAEGYALQVVREGPRRGLVLSGRDAAGVYFAAQSVAQLLERRDGRALLHPAAVRDWPAYRLRSFKTGGAFDPSGPEQMARFAPFAKFNCYNICYSTLGADKWVNPDPSYRQYVQAATRHMRARGLDCMPFVNPYYLWKEHIETSDEGDLAKLFEACRLGPEAGGGRVMLCLDDFASEPKWGGPGLYHVRSARDREKFGDDLAAVNVAMVNDLSRRMKAAYPRCRLYVVLPYYWNPQGSYQAAGEQYLQAVGKGLDPAVTVVWTGPNVRSAVIGESQLDTYQRLLGGRKVMLWDNTIYMHHNPPYYFLDTFHTRYPARFWELMSGEVHLNAGGGEIYKCGLLSAADYLWNPGAFDPERSLRNAVAALAGPDQVDDLLAFRDAFYTVYDQYGLQLGKPAAFLAKVKTMTSRPFDDAALGAVRETLDLEQRLAGRIAAGCTNAALVQAVKDRTADHAAYREALAAIAALPPLSEADAANLAPNPDAEQLTDRLGGTVRLPGPPAAGCVPLGWGRYQGAGTATFTAAPGRDGGACGRLTADTLHDWGDGRTSINVALMVGDCDGFDGPRAAPVLPLHGYYYSFWLKGSAPRVVVTFTTWGEKGTREVRGVAAMPPAVLAPTAQWRFYSGSFVTGPQTARGALKIGIDGYSDEGGGLGEICVDDVYVGRSKQASLRLAP